MKNLRRIDVLLKEYKYYREKIKYEDICKISLMQ